MHKKSQNLILSILFVSLLCSCQKAVREDYYNFVNSNRYTRIPAKNIVCKRGICEAFIIQSEPRKEKHYKSGINAGETTEITRKIRFKCKTHTTELITYTERSIEKNVVLESLDFSDDLRERHTIPNSYASSWEAYVCQGQKDFTALDY